jgi:large subunit ribosomal protein L21
MFAIIETGGKQYKAIVGGKIKIEKLAVETGSSYVFDKVLLIDDDKETLVGTPYLKGAKVEAKILGEHRYKKVITFKIKPKKRYRKKQGHRQFYTEVEITKISGS